MAFGGHERRELGRLVAEHLLHLAPLREGVRPEGRAVLGQLVDQSLGASQAAVDAADAVDANEEGQGEANDGRDVILGEEGVKPGQLGVRIFRQGGGAEILKPQARLDLGLALQKIQVPTRLLVERLQLCLSRLGGLLVLLASSCRLGDSAGPVSALFRLGIHEVLELATNKNLPVLLERHEVGLGQQRIRERLDLLRVLFAQLRELGNELGQALHTGLGESFQLLRGRRLGSDGLKIGLHQPNQPGNLLRVLHVGVELHVLRQALEHLPGDVAVRRLVFREVKRQLAGEVFALVHHLHECVEPDGTQGLGAHPLAVFLRQLHAHLRALLVLGLDLFLEREGLEGARVAREVSHLRERFHRGVQRHGDACDDLGLERKQHPSPPSLHA
mmetsp:Transcript_11137/g.21891  ORF Transcript_11137/g.21891 Transcript_11137/m.21891 type:complete len:388 (-) Transcript_11137:1108-2271(-)